MVTMVALGKRRTRVSSSDNGDSLSIDLPNDSVEWTAPPASACSSKSQTVTMQTLSKQASSASSYTATIANRKDIFSDPRLAIFMEKARYEAFVDPYRGIFPRFPLASDPISDASHDVIQNHTNEDTSALHPGQNVWVYTRHPATILSIDDDQNHVIVRWSARQAQERVEMGKIAPIAEYSHARNGMDLSNHDVSANKDVKREIDVHLENASPWMECRNVLNDISTWKYTFPEGLDVDRLQANDNDAYNGTDAASRLVTCNCPSVSAWAQEEWDSLEKERLASLKKKGTKSRKRKRQKDTDVVIVDGSGDEGENENYLEKKMNAAKGVPSKCDIVCGRRDDHNECPCDYNPFCLASLGGIFDEYRYNVAKTKQMLTETSNATLSKDDFAALLRENWSEMPMKMSRKRGAEQNGKDNNFRIRGSIIVNRHNVETYLLTNVCGSNDGALSIERCMELLHNHHKSLILPSSHIPLSKNTSDLQLSKPPGLRNLGATCYLNSQLQCLAQNLGFVHGLLSWKPTLPVSSEQGSLSSAKRMNNVLSSMQSIIARMRYGHESIICTNDFASALGLENDEMQDPNEFAGLLFDRMQDSFKQCATISGQAELDNLIPSIYWGKSSIEISCSVCTYTSKRVEDFKCLPIPIIDCEDESRNFRAKGISNDVDVQQLLDISLRPESLDGDNQYLCSRCNKKCDAMRHPKFEHLPPVLNLQLNRYVFDRQTFSKQKLTTKVLLPHSLDVPVNGVDKRTYVLVAVQNHLGNSAHGGHYVANVLDWSTGVWFEFNDEDVDALEDGPLAGFWPDKSNDANGEGKRRKISGSADAYNLLYVEKTYLSLQSQSDLMRYGEDYRACKTPRSSTADTSIYQHHASIRRKKYKLEEESQNKKSREQSRLDYRRKRILDALLFPHSNLILPNQCRSNSYNVLVDSHILKRFFSCTDGLKDIFESASEKAILDTKYLLCEHEAGIHPKTAAKLKLLSIEAFNFFSNTLQAEFHMFLRDEMPSNGRVEQSIASSNHIFAVRKNVLCEDCSLSHQLEMRQKFNVLENLITTYEALLSGSNDLDIIHDTPDETCAISRSFVTSFRKYVEEVVKSLFRGSNKKSESIPHGDALYSLDFSELFNEETAEDKVSPEKESTESERLDISVNSRITCVHGSCNVMHNRRSTRLIPKALWTKIVEIFPKAIMHAYEMPNSVCIGNCGECYLEKEAADHFPMKLNEWKCNVKQNPTLLNILQNEHPSIFQKGNGNFYIIHRDELQAWRDAYSYLVKSKKNVPNDTVRNKLLQLCPPSSSLLICKKHQKSICLPTFSHEKQSVIPRTDCNLEAFSIEDYVTLRDSILALRKILYANGSAPFAYCHEAPKITIWQDGTELVLVEVEPEVCTEGCSFALSNNDADIIDEQKQSDTEQDQSSKPAKNEETSYDLCVHEIQGGIDLEVAASTILADISSEISDDPSVNRRSRRNKKGPGDFSRHSVRVPVDSNIAQIRLLVHEQTGKRLFGQCLHLIHEVSSQSQYGVIELSEQDNSREFSAFIQDHGTAVYHILMSYKDADLANGQDGTFIGTRSRLPKVDAAKEEDILAALSELAFRGKSDDHIVGSGKKAKKRREERGFRGTFLQSSPAANSSVSEMLEAGIAEQSRPPNDVIAYSDAEDTSDTVI